MATSRKGGGEDDVKELAAQLTKTLKEGERILAPTRRPDGTLRKPIRIRAGYTPQDEVAIYQSKGVLLRKEMECQEVGPPGYEPVLDAKPKTKSAKRNERKKEKRLQQAAHDKGNDWRSEASSTDDLIEVNEPIESIVSQMNKISVSSTNSSMPPTNSTESSSPADHVPDIDKRIRALKKKIRLTEAQQQKSDMKPEQLDKVAKLEDWRNELKLLEDKKAQLALYRVFIPSNKFCSATCTSFAPVTRATRVEVLRTNLILMYHLFIYPVSSAGTSHSLY